MKANRDWFVPALLLALWFSTPVVPAYGASKEIIELQTQVGQLQTQMTQMKQSFDERMGVMKNLLEQNTDVRVIQVLLGHSKLDTTALYTRVATKTISQVMSPLEHIALKLKEIRPPG